MTAGKRPDTAALDSGYGLSAAEQLAPEIAQQAREHLVAGVFGRRLTVLVLFLRPGIHRLAMLRGLLLVAVLAVVRLPTRCRAAVAVAAFLPAALLVAVAVIVAAAIPAAVSVAIIVVAVAVS